MLSHARQSNVEVSEYCRHRPGTAGANGTWACTRKTSRSWRDVEAIHADRRHRASRVECAVVKSHRKWAFQW